MKFLIALMLIGFVSCDVNDIDNGTSPTEESLKRALTEKCGIQEPSSCIALELVGYVDRMLRTAAVQLSDDVLIVDESNGALAEMPVPSSSIGRSSSSLTEQTQNLILEKVWNFMTSRTLRYRLVDNADLVVSGARQADGGIGVGVTVKQSSDIETGRRRRQRIGTIFAAVAMKMGLMGALGFKALTLLVGKALLIGKVALLLASIIGLKKLFSNQGAPQ